MSYTIRIAPILIALTLAACSGMRGGLTKANLESSKKVAVVSLLGQNFHGIHVATTVFGNTAYDTPVPEWRIDEIAEETIVARVRQGSRSAVALDHDPELGARLENTHSFMQGYNYQEIIGLAKKEGADTLILVQPIPNENSPFHKPGYGFYERTFFGSSRRCVYSLFIVSAFSTRSGEEVGWEWGFPCSSGETELEWKDSFEKYSETEIQSLRRKTEDNVKQNIIKALDVLGY